MEVCSHLKNMNNRTRKIRCIVKTNKMNPVYGVTLPSALMDRWLNVFVSVRESGTALILESGAKLNIINSDEIDNISNTIEVIRI